MRTRVIHGRPPGGWGALARAARRRAAPAAARLRNPVAWSAAFYVGYRLLLVAHLFEGRQLPPINDSLYYVFRISRVMEGVLFNDTSITYTYSLALLGNLLALSPTQAFVLGYVIAPFLSLAILLYFFHRLDFPRGLAATCLLLLSFYSSFIGPHTFHHFVPSTLAVLLMLLWLAVVAREPAARPWPNYAGLGAVSLALVFSHAIGLYVILANLCILYGVRAVTRRRGNLLPVTLLSLAVLAVFFAVTHLVPFDRFGGGEYALDRLAFHAAGEAAPAAPAGAGGPFRAHAAGVRAATGGAGSAAYAAAAFMESVSAALREAGPLLREWSRRVYDYFFFFIFPNVPLGIVNVLALAALAIHSALLPGSALRRPWVLGPFLFYFATFLAVAFFYRRGVRMVEFVLPFCFVMVGIALWDLGARSRWLLRVPAVTGMSLVLAFLSYNVTTTENLLLKPLGPLPGELRHELRQGFVMFGHKWTASYLLSQGIYDISAYRYLNEVRSLEGDHHVFQLLPCMGETDSPLYRLYRRHFAETPRIRIDLVHGGYGEPLGNKVELREVYRSECYVVKDIIWR